MGAKVWFDACIICGASTVEHGRQVCSDACFKQRARRTSKRIRQEKLQARRSLERWCAVCWGAIPTSRRIGARTCGADCAAKLPARVAKQRTRRLRAYGLTAETYAAMKAEQNDACLICLRPFTPALRPHIDHCHVTGRVRGLLCSPCNQGLGQFKDNPALLQAAIDYLT